ncbi:MULTISPECIES: flagellar protein FlhE [Yersinia]|uniref:flagellar protein FlhE n=1 Tax=Yersinia TaxID=629 RepID=UPI0005DFB375|nr:MULTISPECIES: flagellar protein FlhE [Yersinia]OVZ98661.1 flagellar protein FlhE [Yersinia frederiksenii]RXA94459.1 flagellar protein FlhE [Yersinia sp. 2105 StPb PI]CNI14426.1 flagellar protein FlhE [Yersinia frederiksenii]CNI44416.1 flagellar protein FlhE [Yersinia frederiksenii]CNK70629.1 flagellar protein FlhE [Yersinia frederiksenii]
MKLSALIFLSLTLFPLVAAAISGSWSGSSAGGVISVGGQILASRPLTPMLPANAKLQQISWRIELLSAPPPGLQIKLCSQHKCILLDSLSGQKRIDSELTSRGPFYFIYSVNSQGQLLPPLNVVSNQLTIIYR